MANNSKRPKASSLKSPKKTTSPAIQKKETPEAPDPQKLKALEKYEAEIREGIIKYYEMGALLQKINDEKLYKLRGCKSFSEYCKKVFDFGRSYGYRLIAYCKVWNLIKEDSDEQIPEHVVRALSQLKSDEAIRECWEEAKEQAGDALPEYKAVEELVKEKKRLAMMESKQFDPQKEPAKIFLSSIRSSVSRKGAATGIIEASGSSFRKLYNSIKEAPKRGIDFSADEQKKLRNALISSLDSVFETSNDEK